MDARNQRLKGCILSALFAAIVCALPGMAAGAGGGCITRDCHKGMLSQKYVHGPVAVELCDQCHVPTGKHAFKLAAAGEELCYICHERGKAKKINCIKCHDPHGSGLLYQLKAGAGERCKK